MTSLAAGTAPSCAAVDDSLCSRVWDWTHTSWLAASSDWLIAKPLRILLILLLAVVARAIVHRLIRRLTQRAALGTVPGVLQHARATTLLQNSALLSERRRQRAETMGTVLESIVAGLIFTIAVLMILAEFDVNIAPLLASAGIVGVALGFGAQTLVKDFISGIFMILEDQYGVGDVIDVGTASGTVESVGLRVTRLRAVDGTVWYVRNGEIARVGNQSQGSGRAVLDVTVPRSADLSEVTRKLNDTVAALYDDPAFTDLILERPGVCGVESLSSDSVVVRVVIDTVALRQGDVQRALRDRLRTALDGMDIAVP